MKRDHSTAGPVPSADGDHPPFAVPHPEIRTQYCSWQLPRRSLIVVSCLSGELQVSFVWANIPEDDEIEKLAKTSSSVLDSLRRSWSLLEIFHTYMHIIRRWQLPSNWVPGGPWKGS